MHVSASTVSLARSLAWLSRARATGVLSVRSDSAVCRMALVSGVVRAVTSSAGDARLGELVAQELGCDAGELVAALEDREFRPPAGAWLVQAGLASREVVLRALREQQRARVRGMFQRAHHALHFAAGPAEVGVYWLSDPQPSAALILDGMRSALVGRAPARVELASDQTCELRPWGRALSEAAAPNERALFEALARGSSASELRAAADSCERTWQALWAFGALAVKSRVNYTLLLRKRAQLRRRASPWELLDLQPGVIDPQAARQALRKLALRLHPDCLGADAPGSAYALSTEVMQALTRAEASLRTG
ncbi:MAG TPA: DUF4388 domain-containing protein [Polyangiales bacterium]|nr:DUF4388 domain-containing protein [Polyangiales bacterium]